MTQEEIKTRIAKNRSGETELNKQIAKLDWVIKDAKKKKTKLAIRVSKAMKHRNELINQLKRA